MLKYYSQLIEINFILSTGYKKIVEILRTHSKLKILCLTTKVFDISLIHPDGLFK